MFVETFIFFTKKVHENCLMIGCFAIVTYPVSIIDCASTGFCTLSLAAVVYDLGCGFVDSWVLTRHKQFRRILMSCPTLKMKVGRFYCITAATTITFFKLVWEYIIDCIITFP